MDVETRLRDVQRRIKTGMVRMETVTRTLRSLAVRRGGLVSSMLWMVGLWMRLTGRGEEFLRWVY